MNLNCALLVLLLDFHPYMISAQSTNYIDFLPLKVGNVWVYECSTSGLTCGFCSGRTKVNITQSSVINGRTYYQSEIITRTTSGSCVVTCGSVNLPFGNWIRVDSLSANVIKSSTPGCTYSPNEIMLDSFKARLSDSISVNCARPTQYQRYVCTDTNYITIFGSSKQARTYSCSEFESGWGRKYAKGIGLYYANFSGLYGGTYVCTRIVSLKGCILNGVLYGDTSMLMSIKQISSEVPENFSLYQNYPNPFNPTTLIKFEIQKSKSETYSKTEIRIYDVTGREIQTLVNEELQSGTYEVEFDGTNYPSGVYYYSLSTENFTETKKMVLIK